MRNESFQKKIEKKKNETMKTVYSECPKKKKHVKNAEVYPVFLLHSTQQREQREREDVRKKSERRMEEREREKGCGYERGNVRKREREERNHDGEDGGARDFFRTSR